MSAVKRIDRLVSNGWFILAAVVFLFLSLVGGIPGANQLGVELIYRGFPVSHGFQVTRQWTDGNDALIEGTVRKRWSCDYRAPPRALDVAINASLPVESASRVQGDSWPADNQPRRVGPWRIVGGAGKLVELHHHHVCGGQDVFSPLGRIQFPPPKESPRGHPAHDPAAKP